MGLLDHPPKFCSQSDPLEGAINKSRPWGIAPNTTHKVMEVSKVMGGTPKSSIYRWMLHEINHPAIEVPPLMELLGENDDKPLEFRSTHAFSPRSTLTRHRPSMKSGPAAGF